MVFIESRASRRYLEHEIDQGATSKVVPTDGKESAAVGSFEKALIRPLYLLWREQMAIKHSALMLMIGKSRAYLFSNRKSEITAFFGSRSQALNDEKP